MAKVCPRCSADTEPLEEETSEDFCMHEKAAIVVIAATAAAGLLAAAGTL